MCRHRERPQRSLQVWGFDVSKQVVSAGAAHVCGMPLCSFLVHLLDHCSDVQAEAGKHWQRQLVHGAGIVIAILASETGKQAVSQCAW